MDVIVNEVFLGLIAIATKSTTPSELLEKGVEILQNKPISNVQKKEVLKSIIKKIAYGSDGIPNSWDDRLSEDTLNILLMAIDSQLMDALIDGIVVNFKKVGFKEIFNKCGILIKWKAKS